MSLDAKPESITIDPAKTAVIVIDMQNDFGSRGGMFDRAGIDISGIQRAVGPTARVLAAARRMGIKIVHLKMGYRSDLSDLGAPDAKNRVLHLQRLGVGQASKDPDGKEYRVLIRDTGQEQWLSPGVHRTISRAKDMGQAGFRVHVDDGQCAASA